MHDSQIEDQLRGVLRAEGDGIPMTITTAELERRLAARRRAAGGRRLSMVAAAVAAIAVVSIVAAGNGWLRLPAIGTVPSPSTSAGPSSTALTRIERGNGDLILEIEPTWSGTGDTRTIEQQLTPTDWVVSIRIACVGDGTVAFEERDRVVTDRCEPSKDGSGTPSEPIVHRVPTGDGYLAVRFTIGAAVTYTVLVETVPLPDRLPAMSPPAGIVDIDAKSQSDRPETGAPGSTRSLSLGVLPASPRQRVAFVCLGSGVLRYTLGSTADPVTATTGEIVCDGVPELNEFSVDASGAQDLRITTDLRTAWHVIASHDEPPSASPTSGSPAGRAPLGRPGQAVLVRPIGASWTTPDSLEVTLYDQVDSSSEVIATLPGSIVPAGKWLSTWAKPLVSVTGWLAIPTMPGPDATDTQPEIVIVDLLDPTATPKSIAGVASGSWGPDDTFAAIAENGIQLYHPATGALEVSPIQDPAVSLATLKVGTIGAPANDPIWTNASDSRFVGMRQTNAQPPSGSDGWGAISADGSFTPTTDLPPTYQRTGLERPTGASAHGLQMACTGSGSVVEAGCTLSETGTAGMGVATRVPTPDFAYLADVAWASDGRDAWLLFGAGTDQGRSEGPWSLTLSDPTGSRTEFAAMQLNAGDPAILGLGYTTSDGGLPIVVLGSRNSWVRAFVASDASGSRGSINALDPTAWFAGWAGPQPDYDPD